RAAMGNTGAVARMCRAAATARTAVFRRGDCMIAPGDGAPDQATRERSHASGFSVGDLARLGAYLARSRVAVSVGDAHCWRKARNAICGECALVHVALCDEQCLLAPAVLPGKRVLAGVR